MQIACPSEARVGPVVDYELTMREELFLHATAVDWAHIQRVVNVLNIMCEPKTEVKMREAHCRIRDENIHQRIRHTSNMVRAAVKHGLDQGCVSWLQREASFPLNFFQVAHSTAVHCTNIQRVVNVVRKTGRPKMDKRWQDYMIAHEPLKRSDISV